MKGFIILILVAIIFFLSTKDAIQPININWHNFIIWFFAGAGISKITELLEDILNINSKK